ncbi:MAG TPA: ABC transporter permease subunit [Mobilitalea sp.]|nr:ABC transporter permease subunit [Mobilitalea sp.]
MSKYLKSEFYRILHIRSSYVFVAICSLLLLSSNILLAIVKQADSSFKHATTYFSLGNVCTSMAMVFLLCIMVSNMIFGNEYNSNTLKNSISYGISRSTIYLSKMILQIVYSLAAFTIIIGIHVGSAYLLLEHSEEKSVELLLSTCFAAIPLFLFVLAVTNCFSFLIESTGGTIAATCGVLLALPLVSTLLGMKFEVARKFSEILPWNLINNMGFDLEKYKLMLFWETDGHLKYWIAGIIQMLIFTALGYALFRKKEIK